jgi:hypothetical protein
MKLDLSKTEDNAVDYQSLESSHINAFLMSLAFRVADNMRLSKKYSQAVNLSFTANQASFCRCGMQRPQPGFLF